MRKFVCMLVTSLRKNDLTDCDEILPLEKQYVGIFIFARTSCDRLIFLFFFQRPYPDIIVQSSCPPPNGTQVLSNYSFLKSDNIWEWTEESFLIGLAIFYVVFAVIGMIAFVADCSKYVKRKERTSVKGHKVTASTP